MKKKQTQPPSKPGTGQDATPERRSLFVEAYIANGGNARQAVIEAGYSPKTAASQGSRLLNDVKVSSELAARKKVIADKFRLRTEDVLAQLAKIVYSDPRKVFDANGVMIPISEWPEEVATGVASIEVDALFEGQGKDRKQIGHTQKVKFWDKNAAIDKAMRHLGQYERDNRQRNPFADMKPDELDRFIERKRQEVERLMGGSLH